MATLDQGNIVYLGVDAPTSYYLQFFYYCMRSKYHMFTWKIYTLMYAGEL